MWLSLDCTRRVFLSHVTSVSSESNYGFKRETLYLVLVSVTSLFIKEQRFLFDIEWPVNGTNQHLMALITITVLFFLCRTNVLTSFLMCIYLTEIAAVSTASNVSLSKGCSFSFHLFHRLNYTWHWLLK